MQEVINKVKTYLGFSLKSGSIIFGYDNIVKRINKIKLIILCSSANEKTILNIKKLKQETIKLKSLTLSELLERDNVKAIGLTNENLTKSILENIDIFEKLN